MCILSGLYFCDVDCLPLIRCKVGEHVIDSHRSSTISVVSVVSVVSVAIICRRQMFVSNFWYSSKMPTHHHTGKTFKVFFYLLCIMNKDDYVTMFETAILTLDNIRIAVHNETYDTSTQKPLLHLLAHLQALCNHVDYSDTPFFE